MFVLDTTNKSSHDIHEKQNNNNEKQKTKTKQNKKYTQSNLSKKEIFLSFLVRSFIRSKNSFVFYQCSLLARRLFIF